jgi:hypothetical protein
MNLFFVPFVRFVVHVRSCVLSGPEARVHGERKHHPTPFKKWPNYKNSALQNTLKTLFSFKVL